MRCFRFIGVAFLLCTVCGTGPHAGQPESLTVVSWGGAYEASQRAAYFEPFTAETGVPIDVVQYNGGIDDLRAHRERTGGKPTWDVIDMALADAESACDAGLIAAFDPAILAPAPNDAPRT